MRLLRVTALLSALALAVAWPFWSHGLLSWLVAWGGAVVFPLALSLAGDPDRMGRHPRAYRAALLFSPVSSAASLLCWLPQAGAGAAGIALLVLVGLSFAAAHGLRRLLRRGFGPAEELAVDVGLLLAPVAGVWLVASRALHPLFGFHEPVVLLTAAHFFYAGLGAPLVLGTAGRLLPTVARRSLRFRFALLGVCAGVPLTALGITVGHGFDAVAASLVTVGMLLGAATLILDVAPSVSSRSLLAAWVLRLAPLSLVGTMLLAGLFAWTGSVARGEVWSGLLSLDQMVRFHGVVNALGYLTPLLLVLCWLSPSPHVLPGGVVTSRLAAGARVGPDFFARAEALDDVRRPTGLVHSLDDYAHHDFHPERVHPEVRRFYEHTGSYALSVEARWRRGFVLGGKLWRRVARMMGQLELPTTRSAGDGEVASAIVDLKDAADGRTGVRGWIRTYVSTGRALYVAAYACVRAFGRPLMNIAFPLPLGSLTSVLRFEHATPSGAIRLVTWSPPAGPRGDEGIYFANRLLPVRLPMEESIEVWWDDAERVLRAHHELRLFGLRYLTLTYRMHPRPGASSLT